MVQVTVQGRTGTVLQGEYRTQPMVRLWRRQGRKHHRTGAGTLRIRQPALPLGKDSGAGTQRASALLLFLAGNLSPNRASNSWRWRRFLPRPILLSAAEGDKYGTGKKRMLRSALSNRRQALLCRRFSPTVREATKYATSSSKGCIAPKDITHIQQEQTKETCYLFEGFMDYLSFLTLRLERCPDRPELDGQDYIVLNSTSNLSKAIHPLGDYEHIHCFLDNDKAGMEAVRELQRNTGCASGTYRTYTEAITT